MTKAPLDMTGISALADCFDVFFLDQFGVLHDGATPYAGVAECLRELKRHGKQIVVLSNSGKRSAENERRLEQLGLEAGNWDLFVSSGEVAWRQLASNGAPKTCYLISRHNDRSAIEGLAINLADAPEEAGIILLTASEGDRFDLSHYEKLLWKAAQKGVPCLCTNPDRIMLTRAGQKFGAGRIAELYASMGGPVTFVGKPYPAIYEAALLAMGNPDKTRVLCIGDSVEHDIAGAASARLESALVRTGIHASASEAELSNEYRHYNAVPDFILPGLIW
jgi:HAD superfamily hydrolase (TIGR01459 family)